MKWYNFIEFKKFMEAMIVRALGLGSSDGFEGRNFFLFDRKRGRSRRKKLFMHIY